VNFVAQFPQRGENGIRFSGMDAVCFFGGTTWTSWSSRQTARVEIFDPGPFQKIEAEGLVVSFFSPSFRPYRSFMATIMLIVV
jgi:hypothetical protein